jgi:Arc/MetJ family transcription regulator
MKKMVRTNITIDEELLTWIRKTAHRRSTFNKKVGVSQIVREALERMRAEK